MVGLNLLATIFIIAILIGLFSFAKQLGRNIHNKKFQWILGAYMAVLLLSAAMTYMITDEKFLNQDIVTSDDLAKAEQVSRKFYDAARQGRLNQVEGIHVNGQWSFKYTGNELEIADLDHGTGIVAERKETDDGIIEVVAYLTTTIMENINFTNMIQSPEVSLKGNKLVIDRTDTYTLEFVKFSKEFTINQFFGQSTDLEKHSSNVMGHQLLYLRIPKSLQIDDAKLGIQIIGEE